MADPSAKATIPPPLTGHVSESDVDFKDPGLAAALAKVNVCVSVSPMGADQLLLTAPQAFMYDMPKSTKEKGKFNDLFDGWLFPTACLSSLETVLAGMLRKAERKSSVPNEQKYKEDIKHIKEKFASSRKVKYTPTHVLVAELVPVRGKYPRIRGIVPFNLEHERDEVYKLAEFYLIGLKVRHMTLTQFGDYDKNFAIRSDCLGQMKANKDDPKVTEDEKADLSKQLEDANKVVDMVTESTFDDGK